MFQKNVPNVALGNLKRWVKGMVDNAISAKNATRNSCLKT